MSCDDPFEHAPDFPSHLDWVNRSRPLSLDDELCGLVTVIVFWTSSCIHCAHAVEALESLRCRFAGRPFALVGVHSGRLPGEQDEAVVRRAVTRLGLRFPVVIDSERLIWHRYGVKSWPTIAVLDASGALRFQGAGEPAVERLAAAIEVLCDEAEDDGYMTAPVETELESVAATGELLFPSKLAFEARTNLLWIADTGHHRLCGVDLDTGRIRAEIASFESGSADGDFAAARFCSPRGLAIVDDLMFVADTGNHAIRTIDLRRRVVTRLAGTGRLEHDRTGGGVGSQQGLASPWDLCCDEDQLYVAMAGAHQIWRIDPFRGLAVAFAGSGARTRRDGELAVAGLAQPMGIEVADGDLLFVDAETSALRLLSLERGVVESLIAGDEFASGDCDGALSEAKLQHPRGLALHGSGEIWIADSLNGSLRRCDAARVRIETVVAGRCANPEGVVFAGDRLFVADTDHHRVVEVDPSSGTLTELVVKA